MDSMHELITCYFQCQNPPELSACQKNSPRNSSHLSASQDMPRQLHFGKVPLSDGFKEAVIADVRMLVCGGERVAASRQAVATRRLCWGSRGLSKAVYRWVLQIKHIYEHYQHPYLSETLIYTGLYTNQEQTTATFWKAGEKSYFYIIAYWS